ncbi:MAG TPA: hypothetical protein VKB57_02340, partial [Acidimicrobiales bacterium]|nr:hypothetical protein [Acidimicrobiales bacterium]
MATEVTQAAPAGVPPDDRRAALAGRAMVAAAIAAGVGALVVVAVNARHGAAAERIAAPGVTGAPRPVEPLWGRSD